MGGENLEEVEQYQGVDRAEDGTMGAEASHMMGEGDRVLGILKSLRAEMDMFDGVVWIHDMALDETVQKVDVLEVECLRTEYVVLGGLIK